MPHVGWGAVERGAEESTTAERSKVVILGRYENELFLYFPYISGLPLVSVNDCYQKQMFHLNILKNRFREADF